MIHEIADNYDTCRGAVRKTDRNIQLSGERAYQCDDVEWHGPVGNGRQHDETGRGLDAAAICKNMNKCVFVNTLATANEMTARLPNHRTHLAEHETDYKHSELANHTQLRQYLHCHYHSQRSYTALPAVLRRPCWHQ